MKAIIITLALISIGCGKRSDAERPLEYQASITENTVTSSDFPEGTITIDTSFVYVDSEAFILYEVATCEIHVFVDANASGIVERMYWIQYEGYLPGLFPRRYDYSDESYRVSYDGREFFEGVNFYNVPDDRPSWRKGSDIGHVFDLLHRNDYSMEVDVMRVRQVLLDDDRKRELMIMYIENLATRGLSVATFGVDGIRSDEWVQASADLRERARSGLTIQFD